MYESGENYLETILILEKKNGLVRSIDIARELNFSKPSVSRAVGILKDNGFITIEDNGYIKLSELGVEKAASVFERHQILTTFLIKTAGVSQETAEEDACKIEHVISDDTFQGIKKYLKNNYNSIVERLNI